MTLSLGALWGFGALPAQAQIFAKRNSTPAAPAKGAGANKTAAPAAKANPSTADLNRRVVAVVNRDEITRGELGKQCLLHYGGEVLDGLVSKQLILEHCERQHVTVTPQEVRAEIDRLAGQFQLPTEQWLKLLEKERGVKPRQYANDVIWPLLALKKVASAELTVSKEEIEKGFQSEFGPAVKVRLIAMSDEKKARDVLAQAQAKPENFGALAGKHSEDVNSASAHGLVQPIRRNMGDKIIEDVAFRLQEGEISPLIPVGNMYVILMCEGRIPAVQVEDRTRIDNMLEAALRERKLRTAGAALFKRLREQSVIQQVYGDPVKAKQMPGVAAIVNGRQISMNDLIEECVERHGVEVLEGVINRKLVEQSLRKTNKEVSKEEIDAEIARAALAMGKILKPGVPDVQGWLDFITKQQDITVDIYVRDQVWPSVALKKLVGQPEVTEEDLRKGFEANFGPRVKARAIVLSSLRKAQEVWEKARSNPTPEFFGRLAEEYSIEANSRALKGEVPPIQKYGGQPLLEKEAFKLEAGTMSGIIQTGATYVILYCEGRTTPQQISFREARDEIYEDIKEKKLRMAMTREFEKIHDSATVDNFLTGAMRSPKPGGGVLDSNVKAASAVERVGSGGHGPGGTAGPRGPAQRDPDSTTLEMLMKDDNVPQ